MESFEFMLVFKVDSEDPSEYLDALYEFGCNDATVSFCNGRIVTDFTRTAKTFELAMVSAVRNVKKAIPNAELLEMRKSF